MRFVADHMLGRLAKWLRILGFNTVFLHDVSDEEIATCAKREKRQILTRDFELANRTAHLKTLRIRSDHYGEQIKEVCSKLKLKWSSKKLFSICLECNEAVKRVPKSKILKEIPRSIAEQHDTFWQCPKCKKIFWAGSHYENTKQKLRTLKVGYKRDRRKK